MINLVTRVDPSIQRALASAQVVPLRKMLRKSTRAGAKPALSSVKALTPVKDGKLRSSWGLSAFFDSRTGSVGVSIEPRSTFSFSDTDGNKRMVTNRGRSHKSVIAAKAKGKAIDRESPWKYAFGIETGHSPKGRMTRAAGGAKMLERSIRPSSGPFISAITDDLRKHIAASV